MKIKVQITRQENATYFNMKINDIVEVEFEEYVAAVTASEIGNGALDACKAQAVACRTFAVSRGVLRGKVISDSSSTAQAYRAKRYSTTSYPNCIQAANETAGQVLTYNGDLISAVFSSNNGGRTVSSEERWGSKRAYLIEQDDPWDAAAGGSRTGHGVGMSQRGASYAAKHGVDYKTILAFYYPHTILNYNYGQYTGVIMNEKAKQIVDLATSLKGSPYVWGATGEKCTVANRNKRLKSSKLSDTSRANIIKRCQYLSTNGKKGCSTCKYNGMCQYDCIGFVNYVNNTCGIKLYGLGATYHYNHAANFVQRGEIKDMPNLVCCVYKKEGNKMSHIGLHIGDGNIIHCSGEVKDGKITDKGWTHYAIPVGIYSDEELAQAQSIDIPDSITILLKKGSKGTQVVQLQLMLNMLGYNCGSADGVFGAKTDAAVRLFQEKNNLTIDGKVGAMTWPIIKEQYDLTICSKEEDIQDEIEEEEVEEENPYEDEEEEYDEYEDIRTALNIIKERLEQLQEEIKLLEDKI